MKDAGLTPKRTLTVLPAISRRLLAHSLVPLAVALIVASLFRHGQLVGFGDNVFDLSPANELAKSFPAWSHRTDYFGSVDDGASWTVWFLLLWPLERIFGRGVTQAIVLWSLITGAYVAFRYFMLEVRVGWRAATAAAVTYAFNPLTLLILNNNYPLEWLAVALPIFAIILTQAAKLKKRRTTLTLLFVLLCTLSLPMLAANPALLALFIIAVIAAHAAIAVTVKVRIAYLRWLAATLFWVFVCSLWWLLPSAIRYLSAPRIANTNAVSYSWVVARGTLLNVMRLNTLWEWRYGDYYPFAHRSDHNLLLYGSGFFLVVLLICAPIISRSHFVRRRLSVPLLGALVALFLSKGLHPPLTQIAAAFYRLPGAFLFREPTFKFGVVAIFLLAANAGFVFHLVQARIKHKDLALILCCAASLLSWWPAITGAIMRGSSGPALSGEVGLPSTYYRVPPYWSSLAAYLRENANGEGLLVLPADTFYDRDYKWGLYGADYLPMWVLPARVWTIGTSMYTASEALQAYSGLIARYLANNDPRLPHLLRELGIQYVLFRGDVTSRSPEDLWSEAFAQRFVAHYNALKFGPLRLIDIGQPVSEVFEKRAAMTSLTFQPNSVQRLLGVAAQRRRRFEKSRANNRSVWEPQFDWSYLDQYGSLNVRLLNPAPKAMLATITIGALTGHSDPCTLSHLAWHKRAAAQGGALKVRLLQFKSVLLLPGFNGLSLSCAHWSVPGFAERQSDGVRRGQVFFSGARFLSRRAEALQKRYGQESKMYVYARIRHFYSKVVPGTSLSIVGLKGTPADLGALLHLDTPTESTMCFAPIGISHTVAADLAVANCLATQGISSPLDVSISGMEIVGSGHLAPGMASGLRVSVRNVCRSSTCSILGAWEKTRMRATACAPHCIMDPLVGRTALRFQRLAPGALIVQPSSGKSIVGLLEAYSNTWRAFDLRTGASLPHTVVDGWQNGWLVSSTEPIAIVNLACVAQYVALVLAVGIIVALSIRASRRSRNSL